MNTRISIQQLKNEVTGYAGNVCAVSNGASAAGFTTRQFRCAWAGNELCVGASETVAYITVDTTMLLNISKMQCVNGSIEYEINLTDGTCVTVCIESGRDKA